MGRSLTAHEGCFYVYGTRHNRHESRNRIKNIFPSTNEIQNPHPLKNMFSPPWKATPAGQGSEGLRPDGP
jgi:hypothetical protein